MINVRDPIFGAKGGGIIDDWLAFQRAIDCAGGRPILVPADTYLIGRTLNYQTQGEAQGLQIHGEGILATKLNFTGSGPCLNLDGSGIAGGFQYGGKLEGFSIIGSGQRGVDIRSNWNLGIERVQIRGLASDAIRVVNAAASSDDDSTEYLEVARAPLAS